jgi:AcrR family transcriptional regulator
VSRIERPQEKPTDQRVQRTRDRLGDALVALLQEKRFDSITVQEVLDRAEVGRSTFYAHFKDKQDLFLSDVDDFLGLFASLLDRHGEPLDRVAPVREFFAHVAESRAIHAALVESGKVHELLDLAREHFARSIDARLARSPRARDIAAERRAALSRAFSGAMLSLLMWWVHGADPATPDEMDELFHSMVWNGVGASSA